MLLFLWFPIPRRIWGHLQRLHTQSDLQLITFNLQLPVAFFLPSAPAFSPFPPLPATPVPIPTQSSGPFPGISPPFSFLTPPPNHPTAQTWPRSKTFLTSVSVFRTCKTPSRAGLGGKAGIPHMEMVGKVPRSLLAVLYVEH